MREIVAVLHDIRSVHNVGSIFRTADAAGIKKIYLCGITPLPFDQFGRVRADFAKVALGAERSVAWEECATIVPVLKRLRREGFMIAAVEQAPHSVSLMSLRKKRQPLALVMGNEVEGVPARVLKNADIVVEIPMRGAKESLNVAVAFGVAAYGVQY